MSDDERVAKHAVNTLSRNTDDFLDVWAILCGVGCECVCVCGGGGGGGGAVIVE